MKVIADTNIIISALISPKGKESDIILNPLYGFTFDEEIQEGDTAVENDGVTVVVDPMSYQYLEGAEVDFKDSLEGSMFVINNPNATTTCGCGSSFSI